MRMLIAAFIAGQWGVLFWTEPNYYGALLLPYVAFFALILSWNFVKNFHHQQFIHRKLTLCLSLFAYVIGVSITFSELSSYHPVPNSVDRSVVEVEGVVATLPKQQHKSMSFEVKIINVLEGQALNKEEIQLHRVLMQWRDPRAFEVKPGQVYRWKVQLKTPHGLKNPHGFDLERWLRNKDIQGTGFIQEVVEFKRDWTWDFPIMMERCRYILRKKIELALDGARYQGVLSALVIGDQQAISAEDWIIFNTTGIGHLISISGLHITMIASAFSLFIGLIWKFGKLSLWMPAPKAMMIGGFVAAFFYTWLAGFQIPAQRTMLMLAITGLGLFLGRKIQAFDIWWWALFCVLLIDPLAVDSPGFWLSFGAVMAMMFALPTKDGSYKEGDLVFVQKLRSSFFSAYRVQVVITIALIPTSLWWFYQFSLVSLLANAIAIPVLSFVVTPLAILGTFVPSIVGEGLLLFAHYAFEKLAFLMEFMSTWSWALMRAAKPSGLEMLLGFLGVVFVILPGKVQSHWTLRVLGLLICTYLIIPAKWLGIYQLAHEEFEMTVWDIGQGNAVLLKTRNHQLLFDTGPISSGKFDPGEQIIIPHLNAEGIDRLDVLMVSHQDADHIGGLKTLLMKTKIDQAYGSIPFNHPIHDTFKSQQVPIEQCRFGQEWNWDGVRFKVWHPNADSTLEPQFHLGKPNEMSCVLEVRNRHHSVWLTGDIEKQGELELVERLKQNPMDWQETLNRKTVLMAPHHGSKTSSSQLMLDSLLPDMAFSQTGYKNRYRHPHPLVVGRYQENAIDLKDTVETGAQIWRTNEDKLRYYQFRH